MVGAPSRDPDVMKSAHNWARCGDLHTAGCSVSINCDAVAGDGGAVWELYTGEALFEGMTVGQVLYAVVYDNKRPGIPPGAPLAFASLMRDCWKTDPAQRCALIVMPIPSARVSAVSVPR